MPVKKEANQVSRGREPPAGQIIPIPIGSNLNSNQRRKQAPKLHPDPKLPPNSKGETMDVQLRRGGDAVEPSPMELETIREDRSLWGGAPKS